MAQWQGHPGTAAAPRPPGPPGSGLFPGADRPVYREEHRVGAGPLLAGLGAGTVWLALFGGLGGAFGGDLGGYAWWTLLGAAVATAVAVVLAVLGDRGVAVGVAVATGLGVAVAAGFTTAAWIGTGDWPLW